MTLKELQKQIEGTLGKELPTAAWLRAGNVPVVVSRDLECGTKLSVYQNGFALYQSEGKSTVFRVDHCGGYTYYGRNVTHPKMNMSWYGIGGSVTKEGHSALDLNILLSAGWPRSDTEMVEHTFEHYASSTEPFFIYYLTVSGHNNYSFSENTQSRNNSSVYEYTPYSDKLKAYFSCQYELEKALSLLIEKSKLLNVAEEMKASLLTL